MDCPRNPSLCGDGKGEENGQSVNGISRWDRLLKIPFPSFSVGKHRWSSQTAETEAMSKQQLASIAQHLQNQGLGIGAENLLKINQIPTETEPMRQQQSGQCQAGEPSANSQSSNTTTIIGAYEERLKEEKLKYDLDIHEAQSEDLKREVDLQTRLQKLDTLKTCWKQHEQKMKSNSDTPWSEKECLKKEKGNLSMADSKPITTFKLKSTKEFPKQEIVSRNLKLESQLKELDELRKKLDQLKKKYKKQREINRQLEHDLRTRDAKIEYLNDRYIALLEYFRYASENTMSEIPLDKSAQQPIPRTNSPRNSDCGSGIGIGS